MISVLGYLALGFLWTVIAICAVGVIIDLYAPKPPIRVTRSDNVEPIRRKVYDHERDGS